MLAAAFNLGIFSHYWNKTSEGTISNTPGIMRFSAPTCMNRNCSWPCENLKFCSFQSFLWYFLCVVSIYTCADPYSDETRKKPFAYSQSSISLQLCEFWLSWLSWASSCFSTWEPAGVFPARHLPFTIAWKLASMVGQSLGSFYLFSYLLGSLSFVAWLLGP